MIWIHLFKIPIENLLVDLATNVLLPNEQKVIVRAEPTEMV